MNVNTKPKVLTLANGLVIPDATPILLTPILDLGNWSKVGMQWDLSTGPSLVVEILQSNRQDELSIPTYFTRWVSPDITGDAYTVVFTITAIKGGTMLKLIPSLLGQIRLTNTSGSPLTVNNLNAILL